MLHPEFCTYDLETFNTLGVEARELVGIRVTSLNSVFRASVSRSRQKVLPYEKQFAN
jgi:hypothetical protein